MLFFRGAEDLGRFEWRGTPRKGCFIKGAFPQGRQSSGLQARLGAGRACTFGAEGYKGKTFHLWSAVQLKLILVSCLHIAKEIMVTMLLRVFRWCKAVFNSHPFQVLGATSGWLSHTKTFSCCRCRDVQVSSILVQLSWAFERWYTNKLQSLLGFTNASFFVIEMTFNGMQQCSCGERVSLKWGDLLGDFEQYLSLILHACLGTCKWQLQNSFSVCSFRLPKHLMLR